MKLSNVADLDFVPGRPGEQPVHRVFVDPGGSHCIATVVISGVAETFYMHAKWAKPKPLPRLKGLLVNAVAWNRQLITECLSISIYLFSLPDVFQY
jgi:vacuolar protein sorting-associated protein 18